MRLRTPTVILLLLAGLALAACGMAPAAPHSIGYGTTYDQGGGT